MPSGGGLPKALPAEGPSRPVPSRPGYSRRAAGTAARPRTARSTPSAPLRGETARLSHGPNPPATPGDPSPHPGPQAGRGGAAGRTHCSTPSRAHRPRRCRSFAVPSAPPAPRRPPPSCAAAAAAAAAPGPPRLRAPPDRGAGPKMAAAAALGREGGEDAFRRLFRFYRRRDASELRGVLDFSAPGGQVTAGCSRLLSQQAVSWRGVAPPGERVRRMGVR